MNYIDPLFLFPSLSFSLNSNQSNSMKNYYAVADSNILANKIYLAIYDQTKPLHASWMNRLSKQDAFALSGEVAKRFMQLPEFAGICKGFTLKDNLRAAGICREMAQACVFNVIA